MVKNNKVGDLVSLWPIELRDPIVGIVIQKSCDDYHTIFANNHFYRFVEQICLSEPDRKPDAYYDWTSAHVMRKLMTHSIDMMVLGDLLEWSDV